MLLVAVSESERGGDGGAGEWVMLVRWAVGLTSMGAKDLVPAAT